MKWVRCVSKLGHGFTYDKIYEVRNYYDFKGQKYIELIDDDGRINTCDMFKSHPNDRIWFEDATAEIRENKINSILDEVG